MQVHPLSAAVLAALLLCAPAAQALEPGSQVGDVIAQIRLTRFSNSADAAGVRTGAE